MSSEELSGQAPTFSDKARPDVYDIKEGNTGIETDVIKVLTATNTAMPSLSGQPSASQTSTDQENLGSMVLEISDYKDTLIYFPFYEGVNQHITLVKGDDENKYRMMHKDKCVGYNESIAIFELYNCSDFERTQWFTLVPPFDFKPK
ncbi:hypothetical protein COBT_000944 [Conglomerata obtusa]